jgi:hypothetical protein
MTIDCDFVEKKKSVIKGLYLTRLFILPISFLVYFLFGTGGSEGFQQQNLEEALPSFLLLLSFLSLFGGFKVLKHKKNVKDECLSQKKDVNFSCGDLVDAPSVDQVDHLVMEFGFNLCADIMLMIVIIANELALFQKEAPNLIVLCAVICIVVYSFWHKNLNTLMSCCK